ncbi:putative membrane protein YeiH [Rhodovulum bhavnagarense]|uniref:Putative membrane protein YeiH n=1 Tax=Rhodovulum bhavnagarense TaxID=992286 RepID=A0A4R2RCG2_9RHOB|nr:trimeric intracellular cation channel family protein [Rhodovulum bhavnagarense]TCP61070.1 putative membrane protein YeiH [Rhodovulum bhavnagarense]
MIPYIAWFDYAGVALFAATGALTASRKQLDIMGFFFLAILTGVGGGTVRDLILDVPVFWVQQQAYLVVCMATAVGVYFTAHLVESRYHVLLWLDAVALSVYAVVGAHKGLQLTGSPFVAIMTGAMTGTLGGILRDVLAGEPNAVTHKEIYITATVLGAASYVVMRMAGFPVFADAAIGGLVAFTARAGAIRFGWAMPPYRSRPGRPADMP